MSYYVSVGDIPQEQSERLPENGQALAKARKSGTRIYGTLPGTGRATARALHGTSSLLTPNSSLLTPHSSRLGEGRSRFPNHKASASE